MGWKRVVLVLALPAMIGCWSGGHRRERIGVGVELLGIPIATAIRVESESVSDEAIRNGARMSGDGSGGLLMSVDDGRHL